MATSVPKGTWELGTGRRERDEFYAPKSGLQVSCNSIRNREIDRVVKFEATFSRTSFLPNNNEWADRSMVYRNSNELTDLQADEREKDEAPRSDVNQQRTVVCRELQVQIRI